jgi:hypothetical protein
MFFFLFYADSEVRSIVIFVKAEVKQGTPRYMQLLQRAGPETL